MKTVQISLNSIDKVKSFVNDITKFDYDFDLVSGRYVIDAKSIMGIFSLDLSKPIDLNIHAEDTRCAFANGAGELAAIPPECAVRQFEICRLCDLPHAPQRRLTAPRPQSVLLYPVHAASFHRCSPLSSLHGA